MAAQRPVDPMDAATPTLRSSGRSRRSMPPWRCSALPRDGCRASLDTPRCIGSNDLPRLAASWPPPGVGSTDFGRRRRSGTPNWTSRAWMWRLTAPWVTPSSLAAADMVPSRTVVSKARNALSGRRGGVMRGGLVGALMSGNLPPACVDSRYHTAGARRSVRPPWKNKNGVEHAKLGDTSRARTLLRKHPNARQRRDALRVVPVAELIRARGGAAPRPCPPRYEEAPPRLPGARPEAHGLDRRKPESCPTD